MAFRTRTTIAALLLAPTLALAGCSGNDTPGEGATDDGVSAGENQTTDGAATDGAATGGSGDMRDADDDVEITTCEVRNGSVHVVAHVENSGDAAASYVIPVKVMQGDTEADSLALFANGVEAGGEGTAEMTGNATDIEGDVECTAQGVSAM